MARTRSQDYDSIKQAILLAAAKLFAERSFEAARKLRPQDRDVQKGLEVLQRQMARR